MSTVTCNGARVNACSITLPYYGAWTADLDVVGAAALTSPVSLVVGDLTLVGSVVRQGEFTSDRKARIVAGGGGWGNTIPAKGYSHVVGVKASAILNDAAREAGESIALAVDRTLGVLWVREEAPAEQTLRLVAGEEWWIDEAGVTQTKARASTAVVAPFTLISRNGAIDAYEIATESIVGWLPGRTFSCPTVPEVQTISSVRIDATNEGKIRLHVFGTSVATERLRTNIRAMIRAELGGLGYANVWEYTIASATADTIDAVSSDPRMPSITKCPMMPGLIGEEVTPLAGSKCRIVFVNGNPARPECIGIEGIPTLVTIADGDAFAARVGDSVTITPAQFAAATPSNGAGPVTIVGNISATIASGSSKVKVG